MRLSLVVAALSLLSLAACDSTPKPPANTAQAATPQSADASQAPHRKKYCNTGSRVCSDVPDNDPALGVPASGLSNTTSNTSGGSPH